MGNHDESSKKDLAGLEADMGKAFYADVVRLEDENAKLRDELSKLFDEKRMWKARAEAAQSYVRLLVSDVPLIMRLVAVQRNAPPAIEAAVRGVLAHVERLQAEHDAVLADAWARTTLVAKAFVREHPDEVLAEAPWLRPWVDRFRAALGG